MKYLKILLIFLLLTPMGWFLSACGEYEWHQKLTMMVDTPNGKVSASSVMRAKLVDVRGMPADGERVNFFLDGEAVVLQVAPGRYLFALLRGLRAFNRVIYPNMDAAEAGKLLIKGNDGGVGAVPLPPDDYPLLVTFDDINDPASVKRVDPANLEAAFGPGYRLNSITLRLTDEPLTKGKVEEVLGWLPAYKGRLKPTNKKYADELSVEENLYTSDFSTR